MKMKSFIISILLSSLFFCSCFGSNNKEKEEVKKQNIVEIESNTSNDAQIPTINVNERFQFKEITLNDLADIVYIPMETNDDVLLNNGNNALSHFSDKYIVVVNYKSYDIHIFNNKGRIIKSFNHKGQGPNEYLNILGITVDEAKKEIYVVDHPQKYRIMVYSFNGDFIRKLSLPKNVTIGTLHNFDDKNLLCEDNNHRNGNEFPYFLISKQSGAIVDRLHISMCKERISPRFYEKTGTKGAMAVAYGYNPIIRFNQDFIIGDISQDTIYKYSMDKTLTPLLIKTPSIKKQEDPITMVIPEFKVSGMFFLEMTERKFDVEKKGFDRKKLVYDYNSKKFYKYSLKNKDFPNQTFQLNSAGYAYRKEDNTICQFILCDELIEANDENKVYGDLKDIVKTLKEDDNPVLMVIKFRDKEQ